jgi:hypothetical protein
MDKCTTKKRDNVRAEAIKIIAKQFGCTGQNVRYVINNPAYSYGISEEIRKAYSKKYAELKRVLV